MDLKLSSLSAAARNQRKLPLWEDTYGLLSFDPGHTTGWCYFHGFEMIQGGQIDTHDVETATPNILGLLREYDVTQIVLEDYRVYRNRQKHHVGSDLVTSRIIGCIEMAAAMHMPPLEVTKQPASIAKTFCTDTRLKQLGLIAASSRKNRHEHDSIRHAVYFITFGTVNQKRRGSVG